MRAHLPDQYLNQKIIWKRLTGRDVYGSPITKNLIVKARVEGKTKMVRNASGQEVVSNTTAYCKVPIQTGDLVEYNKKTSEVLSVLVLPNLDGSENHREVYL